MQSPTENNLIPTENLEILKAAVEFVGTLESIVIETESHFNNSVGLLKTIKSSITGLDADRKELGDPHFKAKKEIDGTYNPVIKSLENGEMVVKKAMAAWVTKQEQLRAEQQRLLELKAQEERDKLEAKAETERQKATEYEAQGRTDLAEKAYARAETAEDKASITVATAVEDTTKVAGISYSIDYDLEVTDLQAVLKFCSENEFYQHLIELKVSELKKIVKGFKGKCPVPGIKVIEKKTVAVRK